MDTDKESLFCISEDQLEGLKPANRIFDLSGKVAVVTGTVGLALHVINRLAECGAKVAFGGRTEEWGRMAEKHMRDLGYEVAYKQTDVTNIAESRGLVEFAENTYGPVDIVIPVAAVWDPRAFVDVEEQTWDKIIDTDLKGQYFVIQAAALSMIKGGKGGKVVTISSVAYRGDDMVKMGMMTPYNAAKAGVVGITYGIAKELKQYGINVNCVAPGGMLTPGALANSETAIDIYGPDFMTDMSTYGAGTPMAATPDEVALVILSMCTDVSNFMYGQIIEVDGGSQFSFQEKPWSYTM